jgi:hypothetical protein
MKRSLDRKFTLLHPRALVFLVLSGVLALSVSGHCATHAVKTPVVKTYGVKDPDGNFVPKMDVRITGKEVIAKKTNPQDKFHSFSIIVNPKNNKLIKNIGLISLEWIDTNNRPTRPVLFAGTLYNPATHVFRDSLMKMWGIKLIDKSKRHLFAGKGLEDLFTIRVDNQALISSETATEKEQNLQLGSGRDVSLNVSKTSIEFNKSNLRQGETVDVDNRSGLDQVLGVDYPKKGLFYFQIIRKPDPTKINRESWDRFTVAANTGITIVLIPEKQPAKLAELNGKNIVIKVYQGPTVRETRTIPIRVSSDLRNASGETLNESQTEPNGNSSFQGTEPAPNPKPIKKQIAKQNTSTGDIRKTSSWLWVLQIFNLIMLAALGIYALFFMLPKIQVLEDRLAKNEMFIHGNREALREEFDQFKEEMMEHSDRGVASE